MVFSGYTFVKNTVKGHCCRFAYDTYARLRVPGVKTTPSAYKKSWIVYLQSGIPKWISIK